MPKGKPVGWPDLMVAKPTKSGVAYYWAPSPHVRERCPIKAKALGVDYGEAKRYCDEVLNPHYQAWLTGQGLPDGEGPLRGSFDWMVGVYKRHPKYSKLPLETRSSYDRMLALVSKFPLKDGRAFGALLLSSITPGAADKLYDRIKEKPGGGERNKTAVLAMKVSQRAWNVARRSEPKVVPSENPFAKMGLTYKAKQTQPLRYDQLMRFVEAADAAGEFSIGTAAMIAFFWLQREKDILERLTWTHYRPEGAPIAKIFHHKTGEPVDMPLLDEDGSDLWPDLTRRLDSAPRHGTLIVTRDIVDRWKKVRLPWKYRYFADRVAEIKAAAGIGPEFKFMGLRHGGNTEGGDAGLTDAQIRALSGHRSPNMTVLYTKQTMNQRRTAARMRRDSRTKGGQISE
ncbi:hypothetical protein RX327_20090 [Bradyrhizobium sp. BEA-2-5]|uniref:tyrosine-type recombinase/integrase n=1 Tax=Bradyrhizobium sp. BEA-2-5 TaxID=3080015 RepID=UPI00293F1D8D|nr:tyrosine-type recombinase/integrase [Bradyrhizobium sp. BEA-2-5]WOH78270.1 hypothetical protein RX327_20090 [Bradyrhizobium sp. BEA-2-5]